MNRGPRTTDYGPAAVVCNQWSIVLCMLCLTLCAAFGQSSREYQFRAVCLARFAQFVEWPDKAFAEAQSPIIIGVLGQDPFGTDLDTAAQTVGAIRGRRLTVQRYGRVDEMKRCHVLFISGSEDGRLESIFRALNGRAVLSVGETEGFVRRGGMIRFITVENKLRFKINPEAARAANLQVNSKLLKWAEVVGEP